MSGVDYYVKNMRTGMIIDVCADHEEATVSAKFFNDEYQTADYSVVVSETKVQP